jgi:hypothetical protein
VLIVREEVVVGVGPRAGGFAYGRGYVVTPNALERQEIKQTLIFTPSRHMLQMIQS